MDVSIIIVNWNTKELLKGCLESIYEQTKGVEFEVIVVDNASSDGSKEMVANEFPEVVLIANRDNRGFAAANNQAMEMAKGRYVLLLNSDTVILKDVIAGMISYSDSHTKVGIAGCRVLNPDGTLQPTCFMFPSVLNMFLYSTYLNKLFPKSRFFGRERLTWWDRSNERDVDVVTGCFMFVRREAIEKVGLMDEQYYVYGEETDWCYRFKNSGWKVVFVPSGEIIHFGGASSSQVKSRMRLQLAGSILLFFKKHRGLVSYMLACLFTALFFLLRIPYWLLKGLISGKSRGIALGNVRTYMLGFVLSFTGWRGLTINHTSR